jgi:hypothetical protein
MKYLITLLMFISSIAYADDTARISDLEKRLSSLEKKEIQLPDGLFINGEIETQYDDKNYDSGWDSRGAIQFGVKENLDNKYINYIGASTTYDSYYDLDHTLDNTFVEKQISFGSDDYRVFVGETDAQRLGFAKTPKISAPLIFTETNFRIDHREKTVVAFGGFEWDNEFDFDSYRLKQEKPWGVSLGWDNDGNVYYGTATVSLFGYADVSYMRITSPEETTKDDQEGYAIGGSLHRFGIPAIWGVELWDDKNTGSQASKNRIDYGGLYSITPSTYVTAHRTENDDLGYSGNYYGIVYNIYTDTDTKKRPDKRTGLEFGLYYHDQEQTSVFTGTYTDINPKILGSIRYKF